MRMIWRPWLVSLMLVQLPPAQSTPAQIPTAADDLQRHVQVSLKIRDGKTVFRSGEPIRLIASFTADGPGYRVQAHTDLSARAEDELLITPAEGVFRWQALHSTPDPRSVRDVSFEKSLSTQPVDLTLALNHWVRFDEPGEYVVRIRTRRAYKAPLSPYNAPWLTTNAVTFTVVPMTDQEEEAEARRLGALLDDLPPDDLKLQTERCEDLAFLAGDAGTREKVRRYLQPKGRYTGNWLGDLGRGFYISRSPQLVIALLEHEMRDPAKPVDYVWLLVDLRLWMELPALVAETNGNMDALRARRRARRDAIRQAYVDEAINSLANRTPVARRHSAVAILSILKGYEYDQPPPPALPKIPPPVRQIIVDEFSEFDPMTQGMLVQVHWKDIRDPKLLPALVNMTRSADPWVRAMPTNAILELSPDRAKPAFIAEMTAPRPVNSNGLLDLPDETLPELDQPLLEQITRLVASTDSRDAYILKNKTRYLARYATAAVLPDVRQLYEARGRLERDTRVNLLAYLDRWDEAGAAERLGKAMAEDRDAGSLLYGLANVRYSKSVDAALRTRLNSADPSVAESAASLISQHGPPEGRQALEARLSQWMAEWAGRPGELESAPNRTTAQGRLQISLIRAILDGKSWKLSPDDATKLKFSCVTESCRRALNR